MEIVDRKCQCEVKAPSGSNSRRIDMQHGVKIESVFGRRVTGVAGLAGLPILLMVNAVLLIANLRHLRSFQTSLPVLRAHKKIERTLGKSRSNHHTYCFRYSFSDSYSLGSEIKPQRITLPIFVNRESMTKSQRQALSQIR
jgi:hypothetical protein